MRAGTVMTWVRTLAVVARAWNLEPKVQAARVRLNEIAARTSHAAFAFIRPEGRWASGPLFSSAMTFSRVGVVTVGGLGGEHQLLRVGEHRVVAPGDRGEADLGDLGVGHPAVLVLVVDRVRVLDAPPRIVGDLGDCSGHHGVHPGGDARTGRRRCARRR